MLIEITYPYKCTEELLNICNEILKKFNLSKKFVYRQYITSFFGDDDSVSQEYEEFKEDVSCIEVDSLDSLITIDAELKANIPKYRGLIFQSYSEDCFCIKICA